MDNKFFLKNNNDKHPDFKKDIREIYNATRRGPKGMNDEYAYLDSSMKSFNFYFAPLLPDDYRESGLKVYIEDMLAKKKKSAIGIEFGGVGNNLFRGFTPTFFKKTIGVTLVDHREEDEKEEDYFKNKELLMNHKVIEGNLLSKNLYIDIEKELKGQKVDFIVERMLAGKKLLPQDINTLMRTLKFWYKILDEEGVMFVESPKEFKPLLAEWDSMITNKYSEVIDFSSKYNLFRLQKLKGAPEELPALDLENINHTEN